MLIRLHCHSKPIAQQSAMLLLQSQGFERSAQSAEPVRLKQNSILKQKLHNNINY